MKGQSAIEYLATYGWMILAVAVIGGIAYTNIQSSCTQSFSDFYTDAVEVNDFGLDGAGNFLISVENARFQKLQFKKINITIDDEHNGKNLDFNLSAGEKGQIKVGGFRSTSSCNTLDVMLRFDRGSLTSQNVTGIVRAPIDIK